MSDSTLMFAGGGTGGHLYPGIAIADCWMKQYPSSRSVFIGSGRKIETEILAGTSYHHEVLPFESPRNILKHPLRFYKNWRKSTKLARNYLARYQPAVVIGLGGFASYPIVREAARANIPIVLLEQNVIPGRATTYLSRWANSLCVTYDQTHQYFSKQINIKTTGNPIRENIIQLAQLINPASPPLLLIQGGSQGSRLINQTMLNYLKEQKSSLEGWQIRHQTGTIDEEIISELKHQYKSSGIDADIRPYFTSAVELYQAVTLVICRAGGTTLAELHTLGLPAIIIPISDSIRNHQVKNATHHLMHHNGVILREYSTNFQINFNQELHDKLMQVSSSHRNLSNISHNNPIKEDAASLVFCEINKILPHR